MTYVMRAQAHARCTGATLSAQLEGINRLPVRLLVVALSYDPKNLPFCSVARALRASASVNSIAEVRDECSCVPCKFILHCIIYSFPATCIERL